MFTVNFATVVKNEDSPDTSSVNLHPEDNLGKLQLECVTA